MREGAAKELLSPTLPVLRPPCEVSGGRDARRSMAPGVPMRPARRPGEARDDLPPTRPMPFPGRTFAGWQDQAVSVASGGFVLPRPSRGGAPWPCWHQACGCVPLPVLRAGGVQQGSCRQGVTCAPPASPGEPPTECRWRCCCLPRAFLLPGRRGQSRAAAKRITAPPPWPGRGHQRDSVAPKGLLCPPPGLDPRAGRSQPGRGPSLPRAPPRPGLPGRPRMPCPQSCTWRLGSGGDRQMDNCLQ